LPISSPDKIISNGIDSDLDSAGLVASRAGVLGVWYFRRHVDAWACADALVYGTTLGWFFGRLGCFAVHDHPGTETRFWLGVYGICSSHERVVACHDLGL
jgi:prolipoprotein diacylglyceryltransferase